MKKNGLTHPLRRGGWAAARGSRPFGALLVGVLALLVAAPPSYGQSDNALHFSGDFRLRYENTSNQIPGGAPPGVDNVRNRGVVRLRAGVTKNINDMINFGARLATGSAGDPNTTDATIGQFVDDFEVNLDLIYLGLSRDNFSVMGGKFSNPFLRTDLVWDGDVNPQGVTASYAFSGSGSASAKVIGIYSIIDERSNASDSDMFGAQLQVGLSLGDNLRLTLAGGYYDYTIESLINADAGDTRSNALNAAGTDYVSDFDLFDVIAILDFNSANEKFPIRFVGDYVKNRGAVGSEDSGFMLDVFVGRASSQHDVRFNYGYAQAEQDAFLAAFSNDNTLLASNYDQHTFTLDYVPLNNTVLNLTWYLFRRHLVDENAPSGSDEFSSRLRLNAVVTF